MNDINHLNFFNFFTQIGKIPIFLPSWSMSWVRVSIKGFSTKKDHIETYLNNLHMHSETLVSIESKSYNLNFKAYLDLKIKLNF